MRIAKHELVAALGLRYDHHSATTMFEAARERAALADKPEYDTAEISAWRAALSRIADRLDRVNARLDHLTGNVATADTVPVEVARETGKADVPAAFTAPVADEEPKKKKKAKSDDKAEASEAKADAKSEAKTDAKTEAKSDAKTEAKAEAKSDAKTEAKSGDVEAKSDAPVEATVVSLTGLDVEAGELVMMCGDFVGWDVEKAREMMRVGDSHWMGTIDLAIGSATSFKFLRKTTTGDVAWEPGDNRKLVGGTRLDVTWATAAKG